MSTRIATWRPMKAFLRAASFWQSAGLAAKARRARETGRRDIVNILSFFRSIAKGGAQVEGRRGVVGGDDLGLAVLRGHVLVDPGLAPDQLGKAHVLEGDVALGKRERGRVHHQLD